MKKCMSMVRMWSTVTLCAFVFSLMPFGAHAAGTATVTFDAVLDTVISTTIESSRPLTTEEKQWVSFKIIRDYGIRTEVVLSSGELGKGYTIPANEVIANPSGTNRDEYLVQYITKPAVATEMSLATFTVSQGSQKTVTLHFVKRAYTSFDTTAGAPGTVAGENTSIATASYGGLVYDASDASVKITHIFPLSLGSKKFLGAIESTTSGKNILIFDATNQYKPILLKKNSISTSFDVTGAEGTFNVRVVPNHNYFIAGKGIFKFDSSGTVSLVKIDATGGIIELLFRGSDGKIYAGGITEKVYIDATKNPLRNSVTWYDLSTPENGFVEISGTTDSASDFPLGTGDSVSGPYSAFEWGVIHTASKVIAVVPILHNIHAKHTASYWIEFIDVTAVSRPVVIMRKKLEDIGRHSWDLTAAEKFYLSYTDAMLFVDDANKKLFDFYEAKTTNLAAGVAAMVSPQDEAVARSGLRRRTVASSFSVASSGSTISFSQLSRSILCERIGSGFYNSEVVRNLCGAGAGFSGVSGIPVDVENGLTLFIAKDYGARLGFFGNGSNGFSWIANSSSAVRGYENELKNSSYQNNCFSSIVPNARATSCLNGFVQQIDTKNFVVYVYGSKHISTAKVVFANGVPMGGGTTIIPTPTTTVYPPVATTSRITSPFSIQSLLKILTRFRRAN